MPTVSHLSFVQSSFSTPKEFLLSTQFLSILPTHSECMQILHFVVRETFTQRLLNKMARKQFGIPAQDAQHSDIGSVLTLFDDRIFKSRVQFRYKQALYIISYSCIYCLINSRVLYILDACNNRQTAIGVDKG